MPDDESSENNLKDFVASVYKNVSSRIYVFNKAVKT